MTKDEKKHFILQHLALDEFKGRSANSSQLALCVTPNLDNSEVYMLCREMEHDVPLNIIRHKDSGDTLDVLQTCDAVNAFKTGKYLFLSSIDNIEFEILNYLKDKSTTEQTRINHILVASTSSVLHTTELLKNMVTDGLIQMTPPPLSLRNGNENDHIAAFENLHRPIKANITFKGKTYFKEHFMDDNKTTNHFNFEKNSGNVLINQPSSSRDNAFESPIIQTINPTKEAKPPKRSWLEIASWITGLILFIIAIYEFIIKHILHLDK